MTISVETIELVVALLIILSLIAASIVEYSPNSGFSRWATHILRRRPRSLEEFDSRQSLDVLDFALIEHFIPRLKSVVIVCNTIDRPTRDLAMAVLDNFQQGARYTFFVSRDGNDGHALELHYEWFRSLFSAAKGIAPVSGENSLIHAVQFDDLFAIRHFATNWPHVPYVFYTYNGNDGEPSLIAFKGTTPGVGISAEYLKVDPTEAEAIIDLCGLASSDFRTEVGSSESTVEAALPPTSVLEISSEQRDAANTVIDLDAHRPKAESR
jgi:hypothetical protein